MTRTTRFRIKLALALGLVATAAFGTDRVLLNPESSGDLKIKSNVAGTVLDAISVNGTDGSTTVGSTSAGALTTLFQSGAGTTVKLGTAAAAQISMEMNRTVNSASRWQTYLPIGSTDWRLWNSINSDVLTVSQAGLATIGPSSSTLNHVINGQLTLNQTSTGNTVFGGTPNSTGGFVNIRPVSGQKGYITWSEAGVADRLALGFDNGSAVFNFRATNPSGSALGTLDTGTGAWIIGSSTLTGAHTVQSATTAGGVLNMVSKAASDQAFGYFYIEKKSNDNTTSQIYQKYFNNAGNTSAGGVRGDGSTGPQFFGTSDRRIKTNIRPLKGALGRVVALRPVTFDLKDGTARDVDGLVAQDVAKVIPRAVVKTDDGEGNDLPRGVEPWTLSIGSLPIYLVGAVKEQQAEIDSLRSTVRMLSARLDALETAQ